MADRWTERLASAQLGQHVEQLEEQIDRLEDDARTAEHVARLRLLTETLRARIDNADPLLLTGAEITNMQAALGNLTQAAAAAQPTTEEPLFEGQLNDVDAKMEAVVNALSSWPAATPARQASATKRALEQLAKTAAEGSRRVDERATAMEQRLAEVTDAIEQQKAAVDALVTTLRTTQESGTEQLADHETRLQTALSSYQSTFDTQQQERTSQFARELDEHRAKLGETLNELQTTMSTTMTELTQQAAAVKDGLEQQLTKAKTTVGLITQTSMTGNYAEYANTQDDSANAWRWAAVAVGVIFVLGLGTLVGYEETENVKVVTNPSKITFAIAMTALASYCANQAGAHRRAARHARSIQLALQALPAYLAEIDDDDKRKEMLEDFAYFFFSRDIPHGKNEDVWQPARAWKPSFIDRFIGRKTKPPE